jgi:pilus assembly protein Flp/PilA
VRKRLVLLCRKTRRRVCDPSAQTAAEYLGVLLVVAAIIIAIAWTDPGQAISDKLSEVVRDITGAR